MSWRWIHTTCKRMLMLQETDVMTNGHHKEVTLIYCSFWFLKASGWVVIGLPKEGCKSHLQLILMWLDGRSRKKHDLEEVVVWRKARCGLEDHFPMKRRMTWLLVQQYSLLKGSDGERWSKSYEEVLKEEGYMMKKLKFIHDMMMQKGGALQAVDSTMISTKRADSCCCKQVPS